MALELETSEYFRDFDWGNLKAFYYVAKVGNISNAAHFLKLAQSSMSRQITGLEKQLGYPLFTRSKSGVKLTRKGEELLKIVETTFIGLKGFTHFIHANIDRGNERKIRVASTHAFAAYVLSDHLIEYNKEHPEIIFEIIGDDHLCDVILNDVDIAIRPYDPVNDPQMQGIIHEPLFGIEKKLYASPEYIEKYGEPKSVDDLKNHKLIVISSNPEDYPLVDIHWILKLGMSEGRLHKPAFLSNSVECMVNAAKKGLGIIGSYEIMSIIKDANLKNILPNVSDINVKNYFIYPEILKGDKAIMNLKTYLQEKLLSNKN